MRNFLAGVESLPLNKDITVGAVSLGCPKNLVDTEYMLGILQKKGYRISNQPAEADVIVVNTCGFIDEAKEESIATIFEMAGYKTKGRCRALIVTGCLSQRYGKELASEMPEVDAFTGIHDADKIAVIIEGALENKKPFIFSENPCTRFAETPRLLSTPAYTAYIRIADGCSNLCSYCAIPSIRGALRSRTMEDILSETERLCGQGVREGILIAQDTTQYGLDLYGKPMLAELIHRLSDLDLHWIRIMYMNPERISESIINTINGNPKICKYLDIPIQHADADILKRMNRNPDVASIGALIDNIREKDNDFILRTTVMVGFPGETNDAFERLKDFITRHPFDRLGAFIYSPQEGTVAAQMPDTVPDAIKKQRYGEIMELQRGISARLNARRCGRDYEVLAEGFDETNGSYYGRSYGECPGIDGKVLFKSPIEITPGQFLPVRITSTGDYDMLGETVK